MGEGGSVLQRRRGGEGAASQDSALRRTPLTRRNLLRHLHALSRKGKYGTSRCAARYIASVRICAVEAAALCVRKIDPPLGCSVLVPLGSAIVPAASRSLFGVRWQAQLAPYKHHQSEFRSRLQEILNLVLRWKSTACSHSYCR